MRCKACGTETPSEALFCPKCGERLGSHAGSTTGTSRSTAATPAEKFRAAAEAKQGEGPGEEMLWEGSYSGLAMVGTWIAVAVIEVAALAGTFRLKNDQAGWTGFVVLSLVIWLVPAMVLAYRKLAVKYELTSLRLIHERGILRRVTDRIEVIDVDDVSCEQGIVERMLGVGTIRIQSSDRTHPELSLLGIENVRQVAELIDDTRRKERQRRGLHIEAV